MQSHWRAVLPFVQGKYYQKLEGPCPSISKDMTKMTLRCIWLFQKSNIFRYQRRKGDGKTPMYAVCPLCQNLGGRGLRDDLILQVEIEVRYLRQFHSSKVFFWVLVSHLWWIYIVEVGTSNIFELELVIRNQVMVQITSEIPWSFFLKEPFQMRALRPTSGWESCGLQGPGRPRDVKKHLATCLWYSDNRIVLLIKL